MKDESTSDIESNFCSISLLDLINSALESLALALFESTNCYKNKIFERLINIWRWEERLIVVSTLYIWSIKTYFWCNSLFCSARTTFSSAFSSIECVKTFNFLSKSDLASSKAFSAFWRFWAFLELSERFSLLVNDW